MKYFQSKAICRKKRKYQYNFKKKEKNKLKPHPSCPNNQKPIPVNLEITTQESLTAIFRRDRFEEKKEEKEKE